MHRESACCSLLLYNTYCITTGGVWAAPAIWRDAALAMSHNTLCMSMPMRVFRVLHPTATNRDSFIYSGLVPEFIHIMCERIVIVLPLRQVLVHLYIQTYFDTPLAL